MQDVQGVLGSVNKECSIREALVEMAEWLGGGLQNRRRGFDSRSQLQRHKPQAARSQARGGWARKGAGAGLYHEIPDVSRKKRK